MLDHKFLVKRFVLITAVLAALIPIIPFLIGKMTSSGYLGFQYNTDDHMVYAAWMRQAMDGRILFDNRFTTDPQPGLTFHAYFLLLGWIAKVVGIAWAATLARAALNVAFVVLLSKVIGKLTKDTYTHKLALTLSLLGGGLGFLVWHTYGLAIVKPVAPFFSSLFGGLLPADVWQPEAFTFPSMLTNSLFMASLCLIITIFLCVIESRESWRPVLVGTVSFALLANIHSYDALLIGLGLFAFLISIIVNREFSWSWLARCIVMAAGTIPSALWLLHVLNNDPVFQARAATLTFSPPFSQVFFGIFPLIALALIRLFKLEMPNARKWGSFLAIVAMLVGMVLLVTAKKDTYLMDLSAWIFVYLLAISIIASIKGCEPMERLIWTFALVGVVAIYFPALFQRKLAMGLAIPWALLAAIGFGELALNRLERSKRNLTTVLVLLVTGASSMLWFVRELELMRNNVSNTTLHPVYLSENVQQILQYLNSKTNRRVVVLSMPGISIQDTSVADRFLAPAIPDLNPIISGLTGAYTYAGHWSETPNYARKRGQLTSFFTAQLSDEKADQLIKEVQPDYIVAPVPEAFLILKVPLRPMEKMERYGKPVVKGVQFTLIEVDKSRY